MQKVKATKPQEKLDNILPILSPVLNINHAAKGSNDGHFFQTVHVNVEKVATHKSNYTDFHRNEAISYKILSNLTVNLSFKFEWNFSNVMNNAPGLFV